MRVVYFWVSALAVVVLWLGIGALLDGPDDLQAASDTQADIFDAQAAAAAAAKFSQVRP